MGILYFGEIKKAMSADEYKSSRGGTYYHNMQPDQIDLWRAKVINGKHGKRVEIHTSRLGCATKLVVYSIGSLNQYSDNSGKWNTEVIVTMSHNGTTTMTVQAFAELHQAIAEAVAIVS